MSVVFAGDVFDTDDDVITDADGGPITDPDAVARLQRDIRSALDGGETRQESRSRSAR